jgi:thiol-disulfide isomerase/thioredoxin
MRRWGARLTQVSPQATGVVAADFLTVPELADEGIRLLEQRWTMLQAEDTTVPPLNASESAIRDSRIQARANAAAALARAVIARGDTARAANLYATIVSVAWNTRILSDAAALSLQLGDTATAVRSHARAAATGNAPANLLASAEAAIPGLQTRVDWREARRAARTQYAALIRENEIAVPIDLNLQVTDSSGRPVTLRELSAQRPLVLAFWSPYCGPSIASLPEIDALAAAVEAKGARFVSIVALPRTPDVLTLVTAQKLVRPQFYPGADIGRALGQWKTPDTYIIDSGGILRYAHSAPSQTQAEFEVLVEFR